MASSRRLHATSSPPDRNSASGGTAFAEWAAAAASSSNQPDQDLSLGFNASPAATGLWSSSPAARQINYGGGGLPQGMGGMFVASPIISDAHGAPLGVGLGVFPLLTATPQTFSLTTNDPVDDIRRSTGTSNNVVGVSSGINLWQNQSNFMQTRSLGDAGIGIGVGSSSGTVTCQDCGNQAKKDCSHRRCRTCCKSRGFDCLTHVKSTWVPAARRRERLIVAGSSSTAAGATGCSSGSTSGAKKPRLVASQTTATSHTSTSNTPPRSFESGSSHQDASFKDTLPGQVRAPAVFKCVKVTAVDDGEDEFAYQAVVKIGGHIFKGFLYDQGVDHQDNLDQDHEETVAATTHSDHQHNVTGSLFPNISELHLGNSRILDPYATSGSAPSSYHATASTFGNQIN